MSTGRWQLLSDWHNAWLIADASERARLRAQFADDHPHLAAQADALAAASAGMPGFLETPALELAARELVQDDPLLSVDTLVGPYRIVALLARGGMGDVYRATDVRLRRDVALKLMARAGADETRRIERFLQEARVTAALDHANIVKVFDVGVLDARPYLVAELLDGETLRARLGRGRLTTEEARRIAGEVAAGLVVAHAAGLVHRDLKPDNVFLTRSGVTKILDFGIAKLMEDPARADDGLATLTGVLLGTAGYLAPEQVRGGAVDGRTDLFALGSMLFEMATGERAFGREHTIDTLHAIVHEDPPNLLAQVDMSSDLAAVVMRLLAKDPAARFHSAADLEWALAHAPRTTAVPSVQPAPARDSMRPQPPQRRWRALATTAAAAVAGVVLIATGFGGAWVLRPAPTTPELRLDIVTAPTSDGSIAVSPDGLKVVFAARSDGQSRLWLRALDSSDARPLPGTERGSSPFWSPDSRSLAFFADSRLKQIDLVDGSVRTLASTPSPLGGAWSVEGTILLSTNPGNPIFRISSGRGELVAATRFEPAQQGSQSFPSFLPDGRHFLFFVSGRPEVRGVYLGRLDGLETRRLFDADAPAVYATGHLLFIRDETLMAQRIDPDRWEPRGDPFAIAEHVPAGTRLSASTAGPIAYRAPSADTGQRQLTWVDRSGREIERVVYPDTAGMGPALSPDGRRVAVFRFVDGNMDLWLYETGRSTWDRVTADSGDDIYPLWSPDGTRMIFGSNRNGGRMNLYRSVIGAPPGSEELLLTTSQPKFPMDWSRDGRFLLFESLDPERGFDIWALPLGGNGEPFGLARTDFNDRLAQFSPDGKWIAYQSDKTGRFEIYVQPFPGPGADTRVSTDGGGQVRWHPSGKELFYIAADDRLMAVPIRFVSVREGVEPGQPVALFAANVGTMATLVNRQQYSVSPDGRSFVMNSAFGDASHPPISVILNWKPKPPR
jgi:eukaryotic-like serine/threonine-protein kinase